MKPMKKLSLFCLLPLRLLPLSCVLLTACTLTTQPVGTGSADSPQWQARAQQLQQLNQYQTRGSFAYLTNEKKVYARFFWHQYNPERYRLLLTNPLGSTELELVVQPGMTQLTDNQGKKYFSDNPEEIIYQLTDMHIPLDNLRHWITGLPGEAKDFKLDSGYLLKTVSYRHNGATWLVNYQSYDTSTIPALPNRLELTQGDRRIKLKMDNWTTK
ncbi:lipoprotein insertase outer membrane protein LolB [Photorhabdus heterorhabditis]|uniref:lipoprotein insertase outer membrane protein LolB n=1 Tax=Photorhabdus heterorhabditis TaxID=880156 RepID=UPI001562A8C9|nr:lipoprotein insertase outer membrane protein LolB [Photorhabdus heterorhabditis]NRN29711.1 lipoprotein localization protein LolB [Photorhabdus heterorhabditis subsp. aluminescens]